MKPSTEDNGKFRWQPVPGVLVFVAVFLPLTLALGFWQLERGDEKARLQGEYEARETAPPVALAGLADSADHQYRRVHATGTFDNRRTVLLENRVRQGQPGFEVVTLFNLADNAGRVWVNRGWIAGYMDRNRLPVIPEVAGQVRLFGHLYQPLEDPFTVGAETWRETWPQVLQNLDGQLLARHSAIEAHPYQLRLDQGSRGALQTGWAVVNVSPQKHQGYAVQWFAMALALVVLAVFANSNLGRLLFARKGRGPVHGEGNE